jgi:hypothetical protein
VIAAPGAERLPGFCVLGPRAHRDLSPEILMGEAVGSIPCCGAHRACNFAASPVDTCISSATSPGRSRPRGSLHISPMTFLDLRARLRGQASDRNPPTVRT